MDKTFAYILIAAFIFVAIVVTKNSSMTEYRNKFCRVIGRSMIALMWTCIIALTTLVILY
jgi:hypothetical protein